MYKLCALAMLISSILHTGSVACETQADFAAPLQAPVSGNEVRLGSSFGMIWHPLLNERRMHTGVDWEAPTGTPIAVVRGGRVDKTGRRGQYGNIVVVDHGAGWRTLYAHLSKTHVESGDCGKAGDVIGEVGSTGLSASPHLHLELLQYGWPVDPLRAHAP
jgi:murein DD-endopeptidase MepM/ murein hydrolase activator NlpD